MNPTRQSSQITKVLTALERTGCAPRQIGRAWVARCPAHPDRTPSLSVGEGQNGSVLAHCHAGCELRQILGALGLRPSDLFHSDRRRAVTAPLASHLAARPLTPAKLRPPAHEVHALWAGSVPLDQDREALAWAITRGLDPLTVADRDLVRALPADFPVPRWAALRGLSWPRGGYRVLAPLYDENGQFTSIHARNVCVNASPKGALPCGFAATGLVLADAAGRMVLRSAQLYGPLWIMEGVPDFLSCGIGWSDAADDSAPALLGVIAGSWSSAIAACVPAGAEVVIAVHGDMAGQKYCAAIASSIGGRCNLKRWIPRGVTE